MSTTILSPPNRASVISTCRRAVRLVNDVAWADRHAMSACIWTLRRHWLPEEAPNPLGAPPPPPLPPPPGDCPPPPPPPAPPPPDDPPPPPWPPPPLPPPCVPPLVTAPPPPEAPPD